MKAILPLLLLATAPAFAAPASCPQVADQLSDSLASAKRRIAHDGEVKAEFVVDAEGRAEITALQGSRAYRSPVRIAVSMLDCERGTPQRYVLNIRFTDPLPRAVASAASATVAHAELPATPR